MDTEQIEQQIADTRVRLDRKLDVLTGRTTKVRREAEWIALALVALGAVGVLLGGVRRYRKRHTRTGRRAPLPIAR